MIAVFDILQLFQKMLALVFSCFWHGNVAFSLLGKKLLLTFVEKESK